jgi:hypothetical protein
MPVGRLLATPSPFGLARLCFVTQVGANRDGQDEYVVVGTKMVDSGHFGVLKVGGLDQTVSDEEKRPLGILISLGQTRTHSSNSDFPSKPLQSLATYLPVPQGILVDKPNEVCAH